MHFCCAVNGLLVQHLLSVLDLVHLLGRRTRVDIYVIDFKLVDLVVLDVLLRGLLHFGYWFNGFLNFSI